VGWPRVALFRGLLLATWHKLSHIRLAEALDNRTSFRRFGGFAAHEPTPECIAFVRYDIVLSIASAHRSQNTKSG
jgi:IS5 family transposase